MHRANELRAAGTPAHAFGNRQLLQRLADDVGNQFRRVTPALQHSRNQPDALVGFEFFQLIDGDTTGFCKALCAGRRVAFAIKGGDQGRSAPNLFAIGLCTGQFFDPDRQAARRGITVQRAKPKPGLLQAFAYALGKGLTQTQ